MKDLTAIVTHAAARKIASSISLHVSFGDDKDIVIHHGRTNQRTLTSAQTIYDLASLTKIVGTTIAIARAISLGKISLDEKPFASWPHTSVRQLLEHRAGLVAHVHFYNELKLSDQNFIANVDAILHHIFATTPAPTTERMYSDLGFIALGHLLEQLFNEPLYEVFRATWRTLGIEDFPWFPSTHTTRASLSSLAPTGVCIARKTKVIAQVHDANCYFMGGLAGHAGLFGTLAQAAAIGKLFLRIAHAPENYFENLIKHFAETGLGFDKRLPRGSMQHLSPRAFGHFGYTGTSLWIDPLINRKRGVVISLLTNRVNECELPEGIFWLRLAINRAIVRSL